MGSRGSIDSGGPLAVVGACAVGQYDMVWSGGVRDACWTASLFWEIA